MNRSVVQAVCRLPIEFAAGKRAWSSLLEESGYFQRESDLAVAEICQALRAEPALVDAWFAYSEDKRVSSGWYVRQGAKAAFEVGFYPGGSTQLYSDRTEACAAFILRELGEQRRHAG